ETDLIEFFGILPSEQPPEEKEFFGSTAFDFQQDGYHLLISFSIYHEDFYLDLKAANIAEPLLALRLEEVDEIRVRRDKPTSEPVLIVQTRTGKQTIAEEVFEIVELKLHPTISIRIKNS